MKHNTLTVAVAGSMLAFTMLTTAAEAGRLNERSGSYATGAGRTGTYSSQVERSAGRVYRQGSVTTGAGRELTRSRERIYDRDTGSVSGTSTGPRGRTMTYEGAYDRDSGVYERTISGPRGGSVDAVSTYDRTNQSLSTVYTGADGRTATSSSVRDDEGGRTMTLVGPEGEMLTRSSTNTVDADTGTITRSVSGPSGDTRSVFLYPD